MPVPTDFTGNPFLPLIGSSVTGEDLGQTAARTPGGSLTPDFVDGQEFVPPTASGVPSDNRVGGSAQQHQDAFNAVTFSPTSDAAIDISPTRIGTTISDQLNESLGLGLDPRGAIRGFTGAAAADAALEGSRLQTLQGQEALELLRTDLSPFANLFGSEQIEGLTGLATSPGFQAASLGVLPEGSFGGVEFEQNPLFQAIQNKTQEDIFRQQSAVGDLGGSGTAQQLQSGFLSAGNDFINQSINRQLPLLNAGQASSAQSATGSSDLITGIGASQAAGGIGAANARAQGTQNTVGALATIFGKFSDIRLKDNVVKVGEHKGLNIYSWEWNQKALDLGMEGPAVGHIAQELMVDHPELVHDTESGYLMVDYGTDETMEVQ